MSEKQRRILGVTGPTGAGKSTVVQILRDSFGFCAIDTDQLARDAVREEECAVALRETFGADLYDENGYLDRALLAQRAFQSDENTKKLNAIVHPLVIRMLLSQIEEASEDTRNFVIDVPLLYESGLDRICDFVIAVVAPYQTRLARIRKRDGLTVEQAKLRMARQQKNKFYESRADLVIDGRSRDPKGDLAAALQKLRVID